MITLKKIPWHHVLIISLIAFYSGSVTGHGNVALEQDVCVRNISGTMVHLSTYQPQHDPEAEYCTEIPKEGEALWVLDLIDHALREMPVAIKIVRGSDKSSTDTVASFYSTDHSNGTIKGAFNLDEGRYTLFVTGEGNPPLHYEYPLRIQVTNYQDLISPFVPYIIAFLLLTLFTDKMLSKRKRNLSDY